jgi:hypothetical protein
MWRQWHPNAVYYSGGGLRVAHRGPWRRVSESRVFPHTGWESPSARLLLAYNPPGRRRAGKDLSGVPVSCQADPHTDTDGANDPALMVIRYLGAGYPGAISLGRQRVPVSLCRHRQIH